MTIMLYCSVGADLSADFTNSARDGADLSGCRLKCEKNLKMKTGSADLSECRLKCEDTVC